MNQKFIKQLSKDIKFAKSMMESTGIAKIVSDNKQSMESLFKNIIPAIQDLERIQKHLIPIMDEKTLEFFSPEKLKEVRSNEFKSFNKDWSWLVNQKSAPLGDYFFQIYKKLGPQKFKYKISSKFQTKSTLEFISKEIKTKFPKRYPVIRKGLEYYANKKYELSTLLLTPHIEGIIWDLGMKKGLVNKGYKSKSKTNNLEEWRLAELSSHLFPKDKMHSLLVNEIFVKGYRNAVLHGRYIYNNKIKEIRRERNALLILMFWRLTDEF